MPNILHVNLASSPHNSHSANMSSNQYDNNDPVHDLPPELLQAGWRKFWSKRENRPYFFNLVTNESLWEMPILSPVTKGNFYNELKISICSILCSVPEEAVDGIFRVIQNAGFTSTTDLHLVQEDDLMYILKPILRRKLIKEWSTIKESKCKYDKMKNEDKNRQINEFLAETKSSFECGTHTEVTMDDLLKKNITSILNSVSEETVNNVIHALKYVGLEFLIDLHFVREDDLIQVLKPCQRRKLVKAWSQKGIKFLYSSGSDVINEHPITQEDANAASSLLPNNASSSNPDLSIFAQRQASVVSNHMDTSQLFANQLHPYMDQSYYSLLYGPPSRVSYLTDHGPLPKRPPLDPRISRFTDHRFLPPGPPPEVFYFTDHDPFTLGPLPEMPGMTDHFYDPLQSGSCSGVSSLSSIDSEDSSFNLCSDYEWKRHKSIVLLQVYTKYKIELSYSSVEKMHKVWEKIAEEFSQRSSIKCSGLRCMYKIKELKQEYNTLKNNLKLPPSETMIAYLNEARNAFETSGNSGIQILFSSDRAVVYELQNTQEGSSAASRSCKVNSGLRTTSVPDRADQDPLTQELPSKDSSCISIDKCTHSSNFPSEKWNRSMDHLLLEVCAKYKKELSCPNVKKNPIVWRKIAGEFSRKHLRCPKECNSRFLISESECMNKIEMLRDKYHAQKDKTVVSRKMARFCNMVRNAFGIIKNSEMPVAALPGRVSKPGFNWIWNKRLALLRVYSIFKTELSSSINDNQNVWEKIAGKVGKNCDAKQCQNVIKNIKFDYEVEKHRKPYELKEERAVFLDEAENAFEDIENPVDFSKQSHLEAWKMSKPDRVKLLQVYSKYKAELSLQNFDVENQIVWGKFSREISKKCSIYYGKRRCFYEINNLKQLYENFMEKNLKTDPAPYYFFDEAKKAFESTEHSGQHEEVNSLKDFTVKQEKKD